MSNRNTGAPASVEAFLSRGRCHIQSMAWGYLIDPPSPFDPLGEWEKFLEQMRDLPQDDEGVKLAIEEAEREVALKRGETERR